MSEIQTKFKAEHGMESVGNVVVHGQSTFNANLTVNADLLYVGGNLHVTGNINYTNTTVAGDMLPAVDRSDLGNTTNRFDVFTYDLKIYNSVLPVGNSGTTGGYSAANAVPLGSTSARWVVYGNTADFSGAVTITGNATLSGGLQTISGNANFDSGVLFVDATNNRVGINNTGPTVPLTVTGAAEISGNVTGGAFLTSLGALVTNTATVTNTSPNVVDSFPKATWRSGKYLVSVANATTLQHTIEILAMHDGTTLYLTRYGEIFNTSAGSFDVDINGANVELLFTASGAGTFTVKTLRLNI